MAVDLTINGVTFSYPQTDDTEWGANATNWASAVTSGMLQKAGGTFTLTAEVDFGGSFGLKSLYYKSRGTNIASAGVIRLASAEAIKWRKADNSADVTLSTNSSNQLTFEGSTLGTTAITASNEGAGEGVFDVIDGVNLKFKSLVGKSGTRITSDSDEIFIEPAEFYLNDLKDVSAPAPQDSSVLSFSSANSQWQAKSITASNEGAGEGVFDAIDALNLKFKSLVGKSGTRITSDANEIFIEPAEFYLHDLEGVSAPAPQDGSVLSFSSGDSQWQAAGYFGGPNLLTNGCMRFAQRGASGSASFTSATSPANSDDTYLLDRWILLSDGNDIVDVSQGSSDLPAGAYRKMVLDVETANKKFGVIQILESAETIPLRGKTVTFSFSAKRTGSSLADTRAAVLSWSGTADSVTSDVVSDWAAGGSDPVLATSWAFLPTAQGNSQANDVSLSTSWQRFTVTVQVPATANNLAVFVYNIDLTTTLTDTMEISLAQLEIGAEETAFELRPMNEELSRCQRYYCKTFDIDTAPAEGITHRGLHGKGVSTSSVVEPHAEWTYPVTMRTNPTVTLFNPRSGGTSGEWEVGSGDSNNARVLNANDTSAIIDNTGSATGVAGSQAFIGVTAEAEL